MSFREKCPAGPHLQEFLSEREALKSCLLGDEPGILIGLILRKPHLMQQSVTCEERSSDVDSMTGLMTLFDYSVLYVKRFFTLRSDMIVILTFGLHEEKKAIIFSYHNAA